MKTVQGTSRLIGIFLFFLVLGATGAYVFLGLYGTNRVPGLVGKSLTEATEILGKNKMRLGIKGQEYSSGIPEGHIVKQFSSPGSRQKAGSEVGVIVSSGKAGVSEDGMISMPSFEDQYLHEAKLTLTNLNIRLEKVTWVHSDSFEKGKIVAQRPLPGTNSREINFLVSLGPYDVVYRCPSFTGMHRNDARALAAQLGIRLVEKETGNRIIAQRPEAGKPVKRGDAVEVTLAQSRVWF